MPITSIPSLYRLLALLIDNPPPCIESTTLIDTTLRRSLVLRSLPRDLSYNIA